mgnify:CR=1 FL=1|jgi:hypothetical protein
MDDDLKRRMNRNGIIMILLLVSAFIFGILAK